MNLSLPGTGLFSCSAAFVPWIGAETAKATVLLVALLVVGSLMARRHAPLRHLITSLGLAALPLLPLLSLTVTWARLPSSRAAAEPSLLLAAPVSGMTAILLAVWGSVAALLLAWLAVDLVLLWAHLRRGTTSMGAARTAELARRLGIRRHVRVLMTDAFDIPCTWGLLRPLVLLPRQAAGWSDEQLDAVLLHELGHVRRMDGLFVILARISCARYWFHPLAWWVQRRTREDAERACDLLVVEQGVPPSLYARHLLEIVRAARRHRSVLAPSMASPSHMARRIVELTEFRPGSARVGRLAGLAVPAGLLVSTVLLAAASVPGTPSPLEGALACSEAHLLLESVPDLPGASAEEQQSAEPEFFTPMPNY